MARKLRTGFELPFSNATGSDQSKTLSFIDANNYIFGGLLSGFSDLVTGTQSESIRANTEQSVLIKQTTGARTLSNGTRGCVFKADNSTPKRPVFDATQFTSGFYCCYWYKVFSGTNRYYTVLQIDDGTTEYVITINTFLNILEVRNVTTGTTISSTALNILSETWYYIECSVDNAGLMTATVNGTSISYATSVSFANINFIAISNIIDNTVSLDIDDLAINDGSGASDNSTPNSIRGYNFFDAATLNTNSGFSQVGGTTVLANLQDGSDSTRASASADLSYIDFSLPTLSGTGMSETAANFTKIEAINVYGRQIEATKASSLLKAKVTDTVAVVNREENLTLPLTVGNDSVTMFDDGSSDWSLTNLDSGDFDFRVTFDKP